MAKRRIVELEELPKQSPSMNPDVQLKRMTGYAVAQAEKMLREGTASSQIVSYYLRMEDPKYKLECEKLQRENELLEVKTKAIESGEHAEERYKEVIEALRSYKGLGDENY